MHALKRISRTFVCSIGFLTAALLAGCGGGGDQGRDPILGLPAATLVSVAVTPATASIAIGATQQFAATATYSDGSSQNVTATAAWSSATPAVATVGAATGLATSVSAGSAVISATFGGQSGSATLTVRPATLTAIAISPLTPTLAAGLTQQFTATGTFSDNTKRDITSATTFTSATTAVVSIAGTSGLATARAVGTSVITATSGALSASTVMTVTPTALVSLAVTPQAPVVPMGSTRQLAVVATFSDGSTKDVTVLAGFASATPASATVSTSGVVAPVAAGSSVITASFGGKVATTTVTVPAATLASITITPLTATIGIGGAQQFIAIGTYSDNSIATLSGATWTSSLTAVATVLNTGVATGTGVGSTIITATYGAKSGTATLNVQTTPPLVTLAAVPLGGASNFAVLAGTSLTNNAGGTTLITGDVGSPSQTVDPTLAAGSVNYKTGATLTAGLAGLQAAATDANGRTCDVTTTTGVDLGGQTFGPGVYCFGGAINITGTVTLNGPGVYIFRTALTLNSTANASVALINGATAANITWLSVGPTTLGANTAFKGTILSPSAAVTLGSGTTLLGGRVFTGGAVTLSNNQISK